jgi:hypothetical protein
MDHLFKWYPILKVSHRVDDYVSVHNSVSALHWNLLHVVRLCLAAALNTRYSDVCFCYRERQQRVAWYEFLGRVANARRDDASL